MFITYEAQGRTELLLKKWMFHCNIKTRRKLTSCHSKDTVG